MNLDDGTPQLPYNTDRFVQVGVDYLIIFLKILSQFILLVPIAVYSAAAIAIMIAPMMFSAIYTDSLSYSEHAEQIERCVRLMHFQELIAFGPAEWWYHRWGKI